MLTPLTTIIPRPSTLEMPSSPTHPTSLSTSLVQQPVLPAQTASLPSAAATLPLRLKVTFDLLLPLAPSPGTRHSKLAQVAQSAAVYPSPAQGGAINVQAGLTVRGQRLPTLGWASERLMAIFATVRRRGRPSPRPPQTADRDSRLT